MPGPLGAELLALPSCGRCGHHNRATVALHCAYMAALAAMSVAACCLGDVFIIKVQIRVTEYHLSFIFLSSL